MSKGRVEIHLGPGVGIPEWIRGLGPEASVETREESGKRIRVLSIKGAEAEFMKGGVGIRLPRSTTFVLAFEPWEVSRISRGEGREVINYQPQEV